MVATFEKRWKNKKEKNDSWMMTRQRGKMKKVKSTWIKVMKIAQPAPFLYKQRNLHAV